MVPFAMAVHGRTHKRVVMVVSAQSGKTETMLDILGERLDTAPTDVIWVGPSRRFIIDQVADRIDDLIENTCLSSRMAPKSRQRVTLKRVSGARVRLAHGRSSNALKSDPFGLAFTDEADEMMATLKGQGNPIGLVDARGDTHPDFVHAITSTPGEGMAETETDPESGLEFWAGADEEEIKEIKSTIWRLWLSGTRYHWAWPCPHCGEYFIPRFSCLKWEKPKDAEGKELRSEPMLASRTAYLLCPRNGCIITDDEEGSTKAWMNERGVYVAPGQSVSSDGVVNGLPPDAWTLSYWASGLCSPFVRWGERAAKYVEAAHSGNPADVQAVKNQGFGEMYSPAAGAVAKWTEIKGFALPYRRFEIPKGVLFLTEGVDVQKDRLVYVVRGWGYRQESWLIDSDEIYGETEHEQVWFDLADQLERPYGGMHIRRAFIDSGFRPGKNPPVHMVYEFCRRYARIAYATKGFAQRKTPLHVSKIDVTPGGGKAKYGLDLVLLDTDFLKSWIQQRLSWPQDEPGAWHVHAEVDEAYCRQIVSEARISKPNGKVVWAQVSKQNHFFDAEAMAYAAAYMLGVQRLVSRNDERPKKDDSPIADAPAPPLQARQLVAKQSVAASLARLNRPRGEIT